MTLRTIDAGGSGDHTTIAAAEAVAAYGDELRIIDSSTYDEEVTWSGATGTPSSSNDLKVTALTEHLGVFTAGPVHKTTGTGHVNTVSQNWMHFRGYTVLMDQTGTSDECFRLDAITDILFERMIIRASSRNSDQDGIYAERVDLGPISIVNCILKGFGRCGVHAQQFNQAHTHTWKIHFCTVDQCGDTGEEQGGGIRSQVDDASAVNNIEIYNNIAARSLDEPDYAEDPGSGSHNWTGSHNGCSDTSLTTIGITTGALQSQDITTELTNPNSNDYSLASGSNFEGAGTDRTSNSPDSRCDLTVDIAKNTRPATPSMGAFDAAAAPAAAGLRNLLLLGAGS